MFAELRRIFLFSLINLMENSQPKKFEQILKRLYMKDTLRVIP